MIKQRIRNSILGIGALALFLVVCLGGFLAAQSIAQKQEAPQSARPERAELYRNQGLTADVMLDGVPDEVTPLQVTFSDRVMPLCQWTDADIEGTQLAIRDFLSALRQKDPKIHTYVSVMPLRIAFDSPFGTDESYLELVESERQKLRDIEQKLLEHTEGAAVPVFDTLQDHQQEYIFFRNEPVWTARGAYYAAQEFLKKADLETFPITDFWEYAKIGGSKDRYYYYLFEGSNPLILQVQQDGTARKTPMVSALRSGSAVFMGRSTNGTFLEGFAHNGRKLLILGENGTNMLPQWLVTNFEQIVQMDLRYVAWGPGSLDAFLQESEITDVYLLVNLDSGDYFQYSSLPHVTVRLNTLLEKPQEE